MTTMQCKTLCLLILVLLVYILVGGGVFHAIEGPHEQEVINETWTYLLDFLNNNSCLTDAEVEELLQVAYVAFEAGIVIREAEKSTTNFHWDYMSSVFFSTTVVSTIGFGNLAPSTETGRGVCVLYAILGIPICFIVIAWVGKSMMDLVNKCLNKSAYCSSNPGRARWLALLLSLVVGTALFILVPSWIFQYTERWNFMEAFYFSFIALSTIGFGDFIMGIRDSYSYPYLYGAFNSAWLLFGLAWLAMVINGIQDLMSAALGVDGENKDQVPPDPREQGRVIMCERCRSQLSSTDSTGRGNGTFDTQETFAVRKPVTIWI